MCHRRDRGLDGEARRRAGCGKSARKTQSPPVLNISPLKFEFVSDFDIRISDFVVHHPPGSVGSTPRTTSPGNSRMWTSTRSRRPSNFHRRQPVWGRYAHSVGGTPRRVIILPIPLILRTSLRQWPKNSKLTVFFPLTYTILWYNI